jgi:tetratricopeptide (TPR) repeat protein
MMIAPNAAETWQTVANVRISQQRVDDAKGALKRSLDLWQDLPPEHPAVPEFPTRIALARLLLEVELEDEALKVLERLVSDDDQSVEAWYLGGWCLYIMGEKLRDAKGQQQQNGEGEEEWKNIWGSSRRWLSTCLHLYELQEYEDERLGEHAVELLQSITKELGEPPEGEDEEWEDASGDGDGDEEMKD